MTTNPDPSPDGSTDLGRTQDAPRPFAPQRTSHHQPPAALGFRMPAEWAPHEGTWFSWPHNTETWPDDRIEAVEEAFLLATRALCMGETVHVNVLDERHEEHVYTLLKEGGIPPQVIESTVRLHRFATNDAWCRDHGGIFLVRARGPRRRAVTDWHYNAWGGKYPPYDLDDAVPRKMARALGLPRFEMDMTLEGGAIDVNGEGLLMTTASCLLNPNRNPGFSREHVERRLREGLGVEQILWMQGDLVGDDTDGHIDNLARFVSPDTVVAAVEEDPDDENYEPLQDNLARLREAPLPDGRPLRVRTVPMPAPVIQEERRLPASYANFYIGNEVVLMPAYEDPNDEVARTVLQECFPERRVVAINCRDVVWGLGAWHCLTQQVPAV